MAQKPIQITANFDGRLQKIFQKIFYDWMFLSQKSEKEIMDEYFTRDFSINIDGVQLSRDDFLRRVRRMRQEAVVEKQEFIEMMEDGDRLFSMHTVTGKSLLSGQPFETRVIAFFRFREAQIHEGYLNSVTEGDPRDADMASRS